MAGEGDCGTCRGCRAQRHGAGVPSRSAVCGELRRRGGWTSVVGALSGTTLAWSVQRTVAIEWRWAGGNAEGARVLDRGGSGGSRAAA